MERVSDVVNRVLEDSFRLLIPMDIRCILATYCLSSSITGVFWGINHGLGASSPSTATAAKDTTGALAIWTSQTFQISLMVELSGLHGRGRKRVKAEVEEVQVRESQLRIDLMMDWSTWTDEEVQPPVVPNQAEISEKARGRLLWFSTFWALVLTCQIRKRTHISVSLSLSLSRQVLSILNEVWLHASLLSPSRESLFRTVWIESLSVKLGAFWRWPMRMKTCFLVARWLRGVVHVDDDIFQKSSN